MAKRNEFEGAAVGTQIPGTEENQAKLLGESSDPKKDTDGNGGNGRGGGRKEDPPEVKIQKGLTAAQKLVDGLRLEGLSRGRVRQVWGAITDLRDAAEQLAKTLLAKEREFGEAAKA